jgi:hypothetical protein
MRKEGRRKEEWRSEEEGWKRDTKSSQVATYMYLGDSSISFRGLQNTKHS